mgnify:CR=1 FL=1
MGVRSAGAIAGSQVGSRCTGCSLVAVVCSSTWGDVSKVVGKGVLAFVASGMGMDPESEASVGVGSVTGGVVATGSSCGVGPASSGELSGSSTVSIVCCSVASLSASFVWSRWAISTSAAPYSSRIYATSSECRFARAW